MDGRKKKKWQIFAYENPKNPKTPKPHKNLPDLFWSEMYQRALILKQNN